MRSLRKLITSAALAGSLGLASPALAATIEITAIADGDVFLLNGNPATPATGGNVNISQNVVPGQQVRAIYEFALPTLTETIVSVTFLASVVQNFQAPGELSFFGFAGNGTLEAADATQTSNPLGSVTVLTQPPPGQPISIAVPLSPAFIAGLGSGFLGLTTIAASLDTINVASLENTSPLVIHPTLRIETQGGPGQDPAPVPEPGTMLSVAGGLAALAARARTKLRRRKG